MANRSRHRMDASAASVKCLTKWRPLGVRSTSVTRFSRHDGSVSWLDTTTGRRVQESVALVLVRRRTTRDDLHSTPISTQTPPPGGVPRCPAKVEPVSISSLGGRRSFQRPRSLRRGGTDRRRGAGAGEHTVDPTTTVLFPSCDRQPTSYQRQKWPPPAPVYTLPCVISLACGGRPGALPRRVFACTHIRPTVCLRYIKAAGARRPGSEYSLRSIHASGGGPAAVGSRQERDREKRARGTRASFHPLRSSSSISIFVSTSRKLCPLSREIKFLVDLWNYRELFCQIFLLSIGIRIEVFFVDSQRKRERERQDEGNSVIPVDLVAGSPVPGNPVDGEARQDERPRAAVRDANGSGQVRGGASKEAQLQVLAKRHEQLRDAQAGHVHEQAAEEGVHQVDRRHRDKKNEPSVRGSDHVRGREEQRR